MRGGEGDRARGVGKPRGEGGEGHGAISYERRKDLPRRGGVIGNWQALAAMLPGEASRVGRMGPRQPAFPGKVAVLQRAMRPVRQPSGSRAAASRAGPEEGTMTLLSLKHPLTETPGLAAGDRGGSARTARALWRRRARLARGTRGCALDRRARRHFGRPLSRQLVAGPGRRRRSGRSGAPSPARHGFHRRSGRRSRAQSARPGGSPVRRPRPAGHRPRPCRDRRFLWRDDRACPGPAFPGAGRPAGGDLRRCGAPSRRDRDPRAAAADRRARPGERRCGRGARRSRAGSPC